MWTRSSREKGSFKALKHERREKLKHGEGPTTYVDGPGPAHEAQSRGLRRHREREAPEEERGRNLCRMPAGGAVPCVVVQATGLGSAPEVTLAVRFSED